MKSEKHRWYAGISRDTAPVEFYMSAATTSSSPAGSQTDNAGPNNTVHPLPLFKQVLL